MTTERMAVRIVVNGRTNWNRMSEASWHACCHGETTRRSHPQFACLFSVGDEEGLSARDSHSLDSFVAHIFHDPEEAAQVIAQWMGPDLQSRPGLHEREDWDVVRGNVGR